MTTKLNDLPQIEQFVGWGKLNETEQSTVKNATVEVVRQQKVIGQSELAIGEQLVRLRDILGPKRMFVAFVEKYFHYSRATAYRYVEMYQTGVKLLPKVILEQAVMRGTPIKEEIISKNPPPDTKDPVKINTYLDTITSETASRPPQLETNPEVLAKEVFNFFSIRYNRLEMEDKEKQKWGKNIAGLILTKIGVSKEIAIRPVLIPESFQPQLGRPKAA